MHHTEHQTKNKLPDDSESRTTTSIEVSGQSPVAIAPQESPAPVWLSQSAYFFRLGLALFLALSLLLSGCQATAHTSSIWQRATAQLTTEQIALILSENTSLSVNAFPDGWIEQMQVYPVDRLLIINFNQEEMCSPNRIRCTYVGYVREPTTGNLQRVFSLMLNPNLPPHYQLFEGTEMDYHGLPCFKIHQVSDRQIVATLFCFNGTTYVKQSSTAQSIDPKD